jgi:hypothetical protein
LRMVGLAAPGLGTMAATLLTAESEGGDSSADMALLSGELQGLPPYLKKMPSCPLHGQTARNWE